MYHKSYLHSEFLSTLSLRRATAIYPCVTPPKEYFYPRSPCGERPDGLFFFDRRNRISIHALLAESDQAGKHVQQPKRPISIHALLAESDLFWFGLGARVSYFYPRSPCGERQLEWASYSKSAYFYPRSPCGERRVILRVMRRPYANFYPRSPCGERLGTINRSTIWAIFLSTLSLRRATLGRGEVV